jgi:dTDP-4-dehydrorhamnose reductase
MLVVRTSAFFSPWDEHNFVTVALRALASGETFTAADGAIVSPTYVPDLVNASLDLLIDGEGGIWHLANSGALTWAELARQAAEMVGLDARRVRGCPARALDGATARRPVYSVLGSERGALLPALDESLLRYVNECTASWESD